MKSDRTSTVWMVLIISIVSALMIAFTAHAASKAARGDISDFLAYYTAATALCEHTDPYLFSEKPYIYPPLFATLCMPLASLPITTAAACYIPVMVAAILLSFIWGTREFMRRFGMPPGQTLTRICLFIAFLIMEDRVKSDLQMFQVNSLLLFLSILSLRWLDRRPMLAGFALGLAMNIKVFPIVMLPYLMFRRRWRTAAAMAGSTVLFGLLPAVVIGWKTNLQYLAQSSGGFLSLLGIHLNVAQKAQIKDVTVSYSVSIPSGMARMFGAEHSTMAWIGVGVILISLLAFGAWVYRRQGLPRLRWPDRIQQREQPWQAIVAMEWSILMAIALVFSPQTNSRHLLLVAPLAILGSVMLVKTYRNTGWLYILLGTGLIWAGLTLPPGSFRIPILHTAHVFWQFVGGPSWVLLASIPFLIWGGTKIIKELHLTNITQALKH